MTEPTPSQKAEFDRLVLEVQSKDLAMQFGDAFATLAETQAMAKEGALAEAIVALKQKLVDTYESKAMGFSKIKSWEQAKRFFSKAIEHADNETAIQVRHNIAICHFNIGLVHEDQDRFEEALENYGLANDNDNSYAKACYARSRLLARAPVPNNDRTERVKRVTEAIALLKQTIRLDPTFKGVAVRDVDFDSIRNEEGFKAATK
ncbi:MAG: hypothetical protein EXR59_05780 [Dehalococcoidia bacterium]|nr:hypothetical protein [Dehalococcoidia bacterium]